MLHTPQTATGGGSACKYYIDLSVITLLLGHDWHRLQEVAKRKEVQKEAAAASAELEKLKAQSAASARMMAELQSANAQLRAAAGGGGGAARAGGSLGREAPPSVGSQLSGLEALLERREKEVAELRQALAAAQRGGGGGDNSKALREQLAELEAENRDLKNELNAFDPAFFEEIEDMKHEHHQLTLQVPLLSFSSFCPER